MDPDREYGLCFEEHIVKMLTAQQGIAVNPKMTYSLVRLEGHNASFIVASARVDALVGVLGPIEVITADMPGQSFRCVE